MQPTEISSTFLQDPMIVLHANGNRSIAIISTMTFFDTNNKRFLGFLVICALAIVIVEDPGCIERVIREICGDHR